MADPTRRFVLVTGADSGIGRAAVSRLTRSRFHVIAACQSTAPFWDLPAESHQRLSHVSLDVTQVESCRSLASRVSELTGQSGLYALVNSAGIAIGGPLECLDLDEWRKQFEVNLFGTIAVTRSLLPHLRQASNSRVINIGSICGVVSFPFAGPYCASKHAIDAMTLALRGELRPWNIQATVIAPGLVNTDLWKNVGQATRAQLASFDAQQRQWYGSRIERRLARTLDHVRRAMMPDGVGEVIEKVVRCRRLRARYIIGKEARVLLWADRILPRWTLCARLRRAFGLPS